MRPIQSSTLIFALLISTFALQQRSSLSEQSPQSSRPNPQATPSPTPTPSPSPSPVPLPPPTVKIDNYRAHAARIIGAALTSDKAYARLAHLTDHIGNRLSGSKGLEQAIAWALAEMKRDGLDNVRGEKVMVPHWVRG
ncbi:MAG TPA: hypothetical protein VFV61_00485, partial [Pyrinomonadaceae bacterium]|nr:hypothetical protein [Pyrinomonadaceae bacterium]